MPRTLTAGMTTHLAGENHSRALMLRLDLTSGTVLGITNHDRDIVYDFGDAAGPILYKANAAALPSELELSSNISDISDIDIKGFFNASITRAALLGKSFNEAIVRLFEVNWKDTSVGVIPYMKGFVARAVIEGDEFKLILHSENSRWMQTIGRIITPFCDAQFGDSRCTKTPVAISATVSSVTDARTFTVSFSGTYANDFFNKGVVDFTSGPLADARPIEIFTWGSGGQIVLWTRAGATPVVGNTLQVRQGCANTLEHCRDVHANAINFRGFPFVPGKDKYHSLPIPGSGSSSPVWIGSFGRV